MNIIFIRHGSTIGNEQKRYVGRTDESLSELGKQQVLETKEKLGDVSVTAVYTSPYKRTVETAKLIFGGANLSIIDDFRECDFGDFEYKTYAELSDNPDYQRFIDSCGTKGFPGGEDIQEFKRRCVLAFEDVVRKHMNDSGQEHFKLSVVSEKNIISGPFVAFVLHGGTIMSILEEFCSGSYYDYQLSCGEIICYNVCFETGRLD